MSIYMKGRKRSYSNDYSKNDEKSVSFNTIFNIVKEIQGRNKNEEQYKNKAAKSKHSDSFSSQKQNLEKSKSVEMQNNDIEEVSSYKEKSPGIKKPKNNLEINHNKLSIEPQLNRVNEVDNKQDSMQFEQSEIYQTFDTVIANQRIMESKLDAILANQNIIKLTQEKCIKDVKQSKLEVVQEINQLKDMILFGNIMPIRSNNEIQSLQNPFINEAHHGNRENPINILNQKFEYIKDKVCNVKDKVYNYIIESKNFLSHVISFSIGIIASTGAYYAYNSYYSADTIANNETHIYHNYTNEVSNKTYIDYSYI